MGEGVYSESRYLGVSLAGATPTALGDAFRGASPQLKIIERFTRVNAKQIDYKYTVSDPEIYTVPYTGEVALNATKGPIYEYACHEGNYALKGILAGAREEEKQALNAAKAAAGGGGK